MLRAVWTAPSTEPGHAQMSQMRGPLILSYSCRKRFPTPRICDHGIRGHKFLRLWSELARRFADSFQTDRKSTRLNSSHLGISYAVFCLKKKNKLQNDRRKRAYSKQDAGECGVLQAC